MSEIKDSSVRLYMCEISKAKLLSPDEERDLGKRVLEGDASARELMILSNLRLVVKIAKSFSRYGVPMVDLISEGNIGLVKAVEKFDCQKGVRFSTYAGFWIAQSIRRALANQGRTVRLPIHIVNQLVTVRRAEDTLYRRFGRKPKASELAKEVGVSEEKLKFLKRSEQTPVSLDAPVNQSDTLTYSEVIQDEEVEHPAEVIRRKTEGGSLEELLLGLNDREYEIVSSRFGLGGKKKTLEDLSQMFGVSRERVRQIQNRAIEKLRELAGDRDLLSFKMG